MVRRRQADRLQVLLRQQLGALRLWEQQQLALVLWSGLPRELSAIRELPLIARAAGWGGPAGQPCCLVAGAGQAAEGA